MYRTFAPVKIWGEGSDYLPPIQIMSGFVDHHRAFSPSPLLNGDTPMESSVAADTKYTDKVDMRDHKHFAENSSHPVGLGVRAVPAYSSEYSGFPSSTMGNGFPSSTQRIPSGNAPTHPRAAQRIAFC
jgi:hypothetical protein